VREQRRGIGIAGLLAIVIAVVIVGGLAGIFPFRQILASERSVELAEQKLDALREENRRLEHQVSALQTTEEVERLAREEFGLVRPGEIGYVATPGPGDDGADPRAAPDEPDEGQPWWRTVWDFLTGRDMVGDD
jgi:cell division protein FtsB